MKKYLSLFIFLIAVVALVVTGCGGTHGYGSDAAGDNPPLESRTLTADDYGAIAETPIGASGLRLKAEAGTLEPGAKIIITVRDSTEGSGNEYLTASAKVYDIKTILESSTGSTAIISSEKSVLVTVPNDIPGATEYFLATRAPSDSNWSFARINDTNSESNPVNASARMVRAAFGSEFYIALHNLNQQFALFAHKDSSATPKKAIITAIDCEAPSTLKEKDGKYVEDLKVNVVLSANNATQLKNSDVILKYNYQNGNSKDAAIKASSASLKNTSDTQAKAGSGNKYAHSFELSSFDKFTVNGEKINIEFTLNMTGVATEEFAENYYIEVRAANNTNFEFLPSCFCNMTLKTVSSDIKFIKASLLQPEDGSVTVPVDQKDVVVQFPDEINWTTDCEALVKVTSTNANETGAQYVYKYSSAECLLFVERQSNFAPNAEYKVEISEGIMGVAENTMVEPVTFSFTTVAASEYTLTVSKGTGIATASEGGSYKAGEVITLEYTTEAGYKFVSWTSDEVTVSEDNKFTMPAKDVTVTANAGVIAYGISYDGLDGATFGDGVSNPVSYDVTSATITLNNPTKTDYAFIGWTGTGIEEGTASKTVTIPQGSMGDRSYVASWTLAVLTFNLSDTVTLEMRPCRAGSFVRGGDAGDGLEVTLTKHFYMGTYEVTNAQYVAIMGGSSPSGSDFDGDNQPVVNVSWNDITAVDGFIDRMNSRFASQLPDGYRFALPTEAQWEYACRAGTETDLNSNKNIENDWDNDPNTNEVAWNYYNSESKTHDVGGLASNSFGLYDMHGNVWEWCADWYSDYDGSNLTDPTGPAEPDPSWGSGRVLRGGGWNRSPSYCASWFRYGISPDDGYSFYGFRLALVPVQ